MLSMRDLLYLFGVSGTHWLIVVTQIEQNSCPHQLNAAIRRSQPDACCELVESEFGTGCMR